MYLVNGTVKVSLEGIGYRLKECLRFLISTKQTHMFLKISVF
jgi:hypothetical protein